MPMECLHSIRDYVRYAVSQFNKHKLTYGHGTTNAYDEAVALVLQSLDLPIEQLEPYLDARLLPHEKELLLTRINTRINTNTPLAYITHTAYLAGYEFYVDERVIIPRSYLAEVIQNQQLMPWIEYHELIHNALDLCTGNGSLAVLLAENFIDAQIVASDLSQTALEVASINIEKYALDDVVNLVKSNLFENLAEYRGQFDLIVTNPPYVDKRRMDSLPKEYHHEPIIALDGGDNGLELVAKILYQARDYLTTHGVLLVEMGDNRHELEEMYPGLNLTWLETMGGDGFVFVVTRADLDKYFM